MIFRDLRGAITPLATSGRGGSLRESSTFLYRCTFRFFRTFIDFQIFLHLDSAVTSRVPGSLARRTRALDQQHLVPFLYLEHLWKSLKILTLIIRTITPYWMSITCVDNDFCLSLRRLPINGVGAILFVFNHGGKYLCSLYLWCNNLCLFNLIFDGHAFCQGIDFHNLICRVQKQLSLH